MKEIETDRLTLREFNTGDSSFIFRLLNTPSWLQFIGDRNIKTPDDAIPYLLNGPMKSYATWGFGLWLVVLKENNSPIGMCGLIKRDTLEDVDIGFALLPDYEKKGLGYEAASATLAYAKKELALKRVVAITTTDNTNSIQLLKKLDLVFEKMIRIPGDDKELMLFATSW